MSLLVSVSFSSPYMKMCVLLHPAQGPEKNIDLSAFITHQQLASQKAASRKRMHPLYEVFFWNLRSLE